jgi:hypothetical protein
MAQTAESSQCGRSPRKPSERSQQVAQIFDLIRYLTGESMESVQVVLNYFSEKPTIFHQASTVTA